MKTKVLYIERKFWNKNFVAFSLEKVFEQVSRLLTPEKYETSIVKVPYGNSFPEILKNLLFFKKVEADIYHITGQIHYLALILPQEKTVLTIHDLGFLNDDRKFSGYIIKKLFLDLPVKRVKYITTVSETTRRAILENTKCPPDKIRLIENPVQEHYLNGKKKNFNKDCPIILQIGITPNKNIPNLIKAIKGIDCCLRIIGNMTAELKNALEEGNINYENAFDLNDMAMKKEFENADIVAFCSTFEGFGLPIIEAQAMRTPVLTSNISPMKEVSSGAAFLANPFDVEEIRRGILLIINDDLFREKIIVDGLKNVERFDPRYIAGLYEKVYEEMLAKNH